MSRNGGKPGKSAIISFVNEGVPLKFSWVGQYAMPTPSMPGAAHSSSARTGPGSGPPCFLLPPAVVRAILLAASSHIQGILEWCWFSYFTRMIKMLIVSTFRFVESALLLAAVNRKSGILLRRAGPQLRFFPFYGHNSGTVAVGSYHFAGLRLIKRARVEAGRIFTQGLLNSFKKV